MGRRRAELLVQGAGLLLGVAHRLDHVDPVMPAGDLDRRVGAVVREHHDPVRRPGLPGQRLQGEREDGLLVVRRDEHGAPDACAGRELLALSGARWAGGRPPVAPRGSSARAAAPAAPAVRAGRPWEAAAERDGAGRAPASPPPSAAQPGRRRTLRPAAPRPAARPRQGSRARRRGAAAPARVRGRCRSPRRASAGPPARTDPRPRRSARWSASRTVQHCAAARAGPPWPRRRLSCRGSRRAPRAARSRSTAGGRPRPCAAPCRHPSARCRAGAGARGSGST